MKNDTPLRPRRSAGSEREVPDLEAAGSSPAGDATLSTHAAVEIPNPWPAARLKQFLQGI